MTDHGDGAAGGRYTAYSYLPAGDIRQFELAPEFGRVPPYTAELTQEQQARASRLLAGSLVISLHDHPVRFPVRMEETPEYNRIGRQHAAYAGLAASGMTVVFDNMMDGTACVTGNAPLAVERHHHRPRHAPGRSGPPERRNGDPHHRRY